MPIIPISGRRCREPAPSIAAVIDGELNGDAPDRILASPVLDERAIDLICPVFVDLRRMDPATSTLTPSVEDADARMSFFGFRGTPGAVNRPAATPTDHRLRSWLASPRRRCSSISDLCSSPPTILGRAAARDRPFEGQAHDAAMAYGEKPAATPSSRCSNPITCMRTTRARRAPACHIESGDGAARPDRSGRGRGGGDELMPSTMRRSTSRQWLCSY